jgi:hypothetical protein
MTPLIQLPDDPTVPEYLERQLVGDQLALVVSELADRPSAQRAMDSLFQQWDDVTTKVVLQYGLSRLDKDQRRILVQRPEYLLHLQERILLDGGAYWDSIPRTPYVVEAVQAVRERLLMRVVRPVQPNAPSRILPRLWLSAVATAAALVVGIFLGMQFNHGTEEVRPVVVAWGWSKPNALPTEGTAANYLNRIADGAAEWHHQHPNDALTLAKRINELRANCSVLLLAEHQLLEAADRDWLRERCRAWAQSFEQQLAALEAGAPLADVRTAMGVVVDKLTVALRQRATEV